MLESITGPECIRALSDAELGELAQELREKIISTVSRTGGHLASNLGAVELTIALHCALDCPRDKLVFDVGHQSYAHKLLTGRYKDFDTIRQQGGISGFPRRSESEYDAFSVGHASTAISAALGMARARDALGEDYRVVAVVGDGALTGGMCYEALNDLGTSRTHMTIILNDNEMSIARNVGALSRHLTRLRNSRAYRLTKARVRTRLKRLPVIGPAMIKVMEKVKDALKYMLVRGSFFEVFGLEYVGPVDGHDIRALRDALEHADQAERPVLLHVITRKGQGYAPAESSPERFHGTAPFFMDTGEAQSPGAQSNSNCMARALCNIMARDERALGITAAMPAGTGMNIVAQRYPGRVYDVGIAEEHALTLAAGMAAAGARPFVCLYSTFAQRAFDQLIHDVALDALPVCLLLDRAGISGADGATHQGIFDISFLSIVPGLRIMSPRCGEELRLMMDFAMEMNAPCAIRYAKDADSDLCGGVAAVEDGRWERVELAEQREGATGIAQGKHSACGGLAGGSGEAMAQQAQREVTLIAVGCMVNVALCAGQLLVREGVRAHVINARFIRPLDEDMLNALHGDILTLEDGVLTGGFGAAVKLYLAGRDEREGGEPARVKCIGYEDEFIEHAGRGALMRERGLDAQGVAKSALEWVRALA